MITLVQKILIGVSCVFLVVIIALILVYTIKKSGPGPGPGQLLNIDKIAECEKKISPSGMYCANCELTHSPKTADKYNWSPKPQVCNKNIGCYNWWNIFNKPGPGGTPGTMTYNSFIKNCDSGSSPSGPPPTSSPSGPPPTPPPPSPMCCCCPPNGVNKNYWCNKEDKSCQLTPPGTAPGLTCEFDDVSNCPSPNKNEG